MNRKIHLTLMVAVTFTVAWGAVKGQCAETPISISPLTGSLHLITVTGGEEFGMPPYGTNLVASIGPDGILLVDAGFAATAQALKDTLSTFDNGNVRIIINTHFHGDHTLGNQVFKDDAVILSHRSALSRLSGDYFHLSGPPSPNRPHIGFDDSLILHFNGEEIRVVHIPACHTDGDVYVHFTDSKLVAAGDLFFADEIPYININAGGSVDGYIDGIKSFIDDFPPEVSFITAHGRIYNRSDLIEYHEMLTATAGLIRDAMAAGETIEQMTADSLLDDWADWNGSFATTSLEAWITTVYNDAPLGSARKTSISEPLTKVLVTGSSADAVKEYDRLKTTMPDKFDFAEAHLNILGYQLLALQRVDDAITIFKLNIDAFPESFNVYDSYAEALMTKGDTIQSIVNYEKSLELNPENTNAVEILKRLRP